MNIARWISVGLFAFALVAGAGWLLQLQEAAGLRTEMMILREENREFARARQEHQRLAAAQLPAAELDRLRSDHAALTRLRSEIEKSKANAEQMSKKSEPEPTGPEPLPQLALNFGVTPNGSFSLDDRPMDLVSLKHYLESRAARGQRVVIRVQVRDPAEPLTGSRMDELRRNLDGIRPIAQELGLKTEVYFNRASQ